MLLLSHISQGLLARRIAFGGFNIVDSEGVGDDFDLFADHLFQIGQELLLSLTALLLALKAVLLRQAFLFIKANELEDRDAFLGAVHCIVVECICVIGKDGSLRQCHELKIHFVLAAALSERRVEIFDRFPNFLFAEDISGKAELSEPEIVFCLHADLQLLINLGHQVRVGRSDLDAWSFVFHRGDRVPEDVGVGAALTVVKLDAVVIVLLDHKFAA